MFPWSPNETGCIERPRRCFADPTNRPSGAVLADHISPAPNDVAIGVTPAAITAAHCPSILLASKAFARLSRINNTLRPSAPCPKQLPQRKTSGLSRLRRSRNPIRIQDTAEFAIANDSLLAQIDGRRIVTVMRRRQILADRMVTTLAPSNHRLRQTAFTSHAGRDSQRPNALHSHATYCQP